MVEKADIWQRVEVSNPRRDASKASLFAGTRALAPDRGIEPRSTRFRASRAHLGDPVNWRPRDGIEPLSTCYKAAIPPLNDAGVGVNIENRTRTFAFTVRHADHYTMLTIAFGVPSTN